MTFSIREQQNKDLSIPSSKPKPGKLYLISSPRADHGRDPNDFFITIYSVGKRGEFHQPIGEVISGGVVFYVKRLGDGGHLIGHQDIFGFVDPTTEFFEFDEKEDDEKATPLETRDFDRSR